MDKSFDKVVDYVDGHDLYESDTFTEKDRSAGDKRKQDYIKAISRRNKDISRGESFKNHPWYNNLHQYSKNKIHCSCPLCAFNAKKHGRVIFGRTLPIGDKKRYESLEEQLKEYTKTA